MNRDVLTVLTAYPQIWHSCHTQHRRTERTGGVLTDREAMLLSHVSWYSPASPKALAKHLGVTPGTLSAVIVALLERGLLKRDHHADDRRRHALSLTRSGEAALMKGSALDSARVKRVLARLSPAQRSLAVQGLAVFATACGDLGHAS